MTQKMWDSPMKDFIKSEAEKARSPMSKDGVMKNARMEMRLLSTHWQHY